MAFQKKTWEDRESTYPNRRTLTQVGENTYDVGRAEGPVLTEGDALDAENMNDLEERIQDGFHGISNPNLLENWDFRNPVNQNGKTEYVGTSYFVDRWFGAYGNPIFKIKPEYIQMDANGSYESSLCQKVYGELSGKNVTCSLLLSAENAVKLRFVVASYINNIYNTCILKDFEIPAGNETVLIKTSGFLPENIDQDGVLFRLYYVNNHLGKVNIYAAKLELGDHQTLARQNDSGEWEIIDPPNYDLQYALCSQYNPATGAWQGYTPNWNNAGTHNSIYRGKFLGNSVSEAQYAEIAAGTFRDLYIGDYWTIGGVNWRIAAFDYYLRCGDTDLTTHHAVIVPDSSLYNAKMNNTNTTEGGYVNSEMRKANLEQAKTTIKVAFSGHVLKHRVYLTNAISNGRPSAGTWVDSEVELMNELMVYGSLLFTPISDGTTIFANYRVEKSQLPLFIYRPDLISKRLDFWLRDIVNNSNFAYIYFDGLAASTLSANSHGVRPAFCIS